MSNQSIDRIAKAILREVGGGIDDAKAKAIAAVALTAAGMDCFGDVDLLGSKHDRSKPRRRMTEDFPLTPELLEIGTEAGYHESDVGRIFSEFRNYWVGRGVARADWKATWRNKIKMELERNPPAKAGDDMFGDLRGRWD